MLAKRDVATFAIQHHLLPLLLLAYLRKNFLDGQQWLQTKNSVAYLVQILIKTYQELKDPLIFNFLRVFYAVTNTLSFLFTNQIKLLPQFEHVRVKISNVVHTSLAVGRKR